MSETKHTHHSHPDPERGRMDLEHRPYWKRAHQDWRFWIGVLLMLAAIMIYVGTGDFLWRPRLALPPANRGVVGQQP